MHVLADTRQSCGPPLRVHTFVHRLCMCNLSSGKAGGTGLQRAEPFLFAQVRTGFRPHHQEAVKLGTVLGKLTAGSRERD